MRDQRDRDREACGVRVTPADVKTEIVYLLGTYAAENMRLSIQEIGTGYLTDPVQIDTAIVLAKTATHFLETARLITAGKHPQMDAGLVLLLATDLLERSQA
jgi:hypothetical protein